MASGIGQTEVVTKIRHAEDSVFVERCLLQEHSLGLSEAPVLGLEPFDLNGIELEVDLLEKKLMPFVYLLLGNNARNDWEIYCPLAVGQHRNHLSVFLFVIRSYETLRKKAKIFFYEDLPYASNKEFRKEAIKRLISYFPQGNVLRHANQMSEDEMDEKMDLVSLYKSQHSGPPLRNKFISAEPSTPFPHEAFWEAA
jgi:hypothetical protein